MTGRSPSRGRQHCSSRSARASPGSSSSSPTLGMPAASAALMGRKVAAAVCAAVTITATGWAPGRPAIVTLSARPRSLTTPNRTAPVPRYTFAC